MNSLRRSITHGQSYWMDDLTRGMMTGSEIPGTPAGVPAIEQMLYEGININVTLLFAIEDYEAVAHAYIAAGFAGRSLRNRRLGKAERGAMV